MRYPRMIIFDYGQTLMNEQPFDGLAGTRAVLDTCVDNPGGVSAEEVQAFADQMNRDMGRYVPEQRHAVMLEVHQHMFQNYLYQYFHMTPRVSPVELETCFWEHAAPARLTDGIRDLLGLLRTMNMPTAVISNISFSGEVLTRRLREHLPEHGFYFVLASSDLVFRKPHPRIFELALRKAGLAARDIWFCGDNLDCDIHGAGNCGMQPVWYRGASIPDGGQPPQGCLEIRSWNELSALLQEL